MLQNAALKGISEDGTYNMQGVRKAGQHGREDMPPLRNIGTRPEEDAGRHRQVAADRLCNRSGGDGAAQEGQDHHCGGKATSAGGPGYGTGTSRKASEQAGH